MPPEPAVAIVYTKGKGDFRIKWTGVKGTFESNYQYHTREQATIVANSCCPSSIEQDWRHND